MRWARWIPREERKEEALSSESCLEYLRSQSNQSFVFGLLHRKSWPALSLFLLKSQIFWSHFRVFLTEPCPSDTPDLFSFHSHDPGNFTYSMPLYGAAHSHFGIPDERKREKCAGKAPHGSFRDTLRRKRKNLAFVATGFCFGTFPTP